MTEPKRPKALPPRCQHHTSSLFRAKNEHLVQPHSYNINDVAITLSESITGQTQWTAREKPLKDTVARILSKQGKETSPKVVTASTIFSLMKSIDDLCFLGLLFPTTHLNHPSHPVHLEVGQARGRVGWTQALRTRPGGPRGAVSTGTGSSSSPGQGPSILIRLSTVRHHGDDVDNVNHDGEKKKTKNKSEALTLREVVQVAIHEMVHAYLLLLSCRHKQCGADFELMHRDEDGTGHGLAFVALLKAVLGQVQSWAPQLGEFGMTDEAIDPYEDFSVKLWKRGEGIAARRSYFEIGVDFWTLSYDEIVRFSQTFYAFAMVYILAVASFKATMLFFYQRVFGAFNSTFTAVLWGTQVFNLLAFIAFFLATLFQCRPISFVWYGWDGHHEGACLDVHAIMLSHGAVNVALDFWMLVLPATQVLRLNLRKRQKAEILAMFGIGIL
ncbi:hypothetical protein CkaCkLH20_04128 [Colletotrichum karsti]|uniref:Rhodopsin domain-containing protein n=1 Tax=Colletotrichum karsti TaxID=1095194 RepID=A0A9P6IBA4_9PEZI|nr:uncharacterized protein CkaCkLH20_04128 [Colletotrichum karsti]KAF9878636.1 hypothetical protein CkaCkLH20_04128 [Colletotrichum karsti]